jgi:hypothetical protein
MVAKTMGAHSWVDSDGFPERTAEEQQPGRNGLVDMGSSVAKGRNSDPVRLPETIGTGTKGDAESIGMVVFRALVKHYGSVKSMAWELGNVDPSQMRAEIQASDFRRLDRHAKPDARAVMALAMNNAYLEPTTKGDEREELVQCADELMLKVRQLIALRLKAAS